MAKSKSLRMAKTEKSVRTAKVRSVRTAKKRSKQTPSSRGGTGKKLIKDLKIKKCLYLVAIGLIKTCKTFWNKNFYQKCLVYCVKHFYKVLYSE